MRRNLTLIFTNFNKVIQGKDVFLVPYYICKKFDLEYNVVCLANADFEKNNEFKVNYFPQKEINGIKSKYYLIKEFNIFKYLIINAKKINFLVLIHMSKKNALISYIYKKLNPRGKIYVKLDMNEGSLRALSKMKKYRIRTKMYESFFKQVDLYSIENKNLYDIFPNFFHGVKGIREKLEYIPNGFDEEKLKGIKVKNIKEKENIILTVGRIGEYPKNNELLLETLKKINLKNWKVYFVGPYTKDFKIKYDKFIKENIGYKEKVFLTGSIENKKNLYEYYNRAKVLIHTSLSEGFPLIFPEALRFGNYIVTSEIGGGEGYN